MVYDGIAYVTALIKISLPALVNNFSFQLDTFHSLFQVSKGIRLRSPN